MSEINTKNHISINKNIFQNVCQRVVNVRAYKQESISEDILDGLFEAFRYGPSIANHQPWELLLLDQEQKKNVVEATLDPLFTKDSVNGQPWIIDAPTVIVVLSDLRRSEARIGKPGVLLSNQDIFSAIQNFRLAAVMDGLATSVVREIDTEKLKEVLEVPKSYTPVAMITVGYPKNEPALPPLLSIKEFVHKGRIE